MYSSYDIYQYLIQDIQYNMGLESASNILTMIEANSTILVENLSRRKQRFVTESSGIKRE